MGGFPIFLHELCRWGLHVWTCWREEKRGVMRRDCEHCGTVETLTTEHFFDSACPP